MSRRHRRPVLAVPLARWGFTALAVLAVLVGQLEAAVVVGALAAAAWNVRGRR
ncbi:hypothetical protein [Streptomyces sp. WAC 06738]|uniref:hypothetical protein n=1 Tax=Streptomyces sp. WAC 06738 TaxID=2203210 RepID=UPI0013DF8CBA|nr:hypothetical protein [Streptomyces sp. WAC 06738]